jgi:cystathionine beta-lyase/cystathionine gamma-synthase
VDEEIPMSDSETYRYPTHSSHRALGSRERVRGGIGEGLVRISVGIEAVEDIIGDLERALEESR